MAGYFKRNGKRLFAKRVTLISALAALLLAATAFGMTGSAYGAKAANYSKCLMEVSTGRVLYAENADVRLPMASTTKAMTALLAVESGRLQETVTITEASAGVEGSSIYLKVGDRLTLEALTYGLMLRSGNDAAVAIATYLAGSVGKFAAMMNARAEKLGLKNTRFTNPHGLHDDGHYTTAYDLASISAEGLKNDAFRKIVSTKSITFEQFDKKWQFVNKNKLLFRYEGGIGVKTGYTTKAGRCLIAASERNGMTLVAVVLNVPPMFEECARLLDEGYEKYEMKPLAKAGEAVAGVPIAGVSYRKAALTVANDLVYPLKKDGSECPNVRISTLTEIPLTTKTGAEAGEIRITLGNRLLFSENLYIME